ncbi:MAG: TIGR03435 family protein [Terracidiphilus sp.]
MATSRCLAFTSRFKLIVASILVVSAIPSVSAQTTQPPKSATPSGKPSPLPASYDVVSVKPHKTDDPGVVSWMRTTPTGFSANVSACSLIMSAYNLIMLDQISGLPGWAENENFDVEGKLDAEAAEAFEKLSRNDEASQRRLMMQAILADRFGLRIRRELRGLPVYNLVIAKSGLKMKEASPLQDYPWSMGLGSITSKGMPIASLAASLSNPAGRMVIDKTGLTGRYEINLAWSWNDEPGNSGPSLFTALQEQLGLKLEPAKAPIDVVVIDHIERPSEN